MTPLPPDPPRAASQPSAEQLGQVFRSLSERHAEERLRGSRERSWKRLAGKWHLKNQGRLLAPGWNRHLWSLMPRWSLHPLAQGAALLALCCVIGAGVFTSWRSLTQPETLSYAVRWQGTAEPVNREPDADGWLRTESLEAELGFSDGSQVQVAPHSTLHVDVLGVQSARTRLAEGKLSANIQHADQTRWLFVAGPYEVQVVGTRFDLAWQGAKFALTMHEGVVKVLGPNKSWVLKGGESLRLTEPALSTAAPAIAAPETAAPAAQTAAATEPAAQPSEAGPAANGAQSSDDWVQPKSAAQANSGAQGSNWTQWSAWLAKGRFDDVVNAARSTGLTQVLRGAPESALVALAQAAGYTGDAALATQSWRQVRTRFARSAAAARAAFYLARFAEQRGEARGALEWLDTYGREAPSGVLSAEALGRKLTLLRRLDGASSKTASDAAREYLRRFPSGAYAAVARATLGARVTLGAQ
jgi:hypothetical protein